MKLIARLLLCTAIAGSTASAWAHPVVTGRTHTESVHSRAPQGRIMHTSSARH